MFVVGLWQGEDSEPLRHIVFQLIGEAWMLVCVTGHEGGQFGLSGFKRGCIPDGSELFADAFFDVVVWRMLHGVLSQMELATLPGGRPEHRAAWFCRKF